MQALKCWTRAVIVAGILPLAACQAIPAHIAPAPSSEQASVTETMEKFPVAPPPPLVEGGLGRAPDHPQVVADELLVDLMPGVEVQTFLGLAAAQGLEIRSKLELNGRLVLAVRVPDPSRRDIIRRGLAAAPGVKRVDLNALAYIHAAPNDEFYKEQWAHRPAFANTEGAWANLAGVDQSKVMVAVIDTGLDIFHPDLEKTPDGNFRIRKQRNVTPAAEKEFKVDPNALTNVEDRHGHGTVTAGIIGATGNNTTGIAGVAWGVQIMPIKADHEEEDIWGNFSLSDVLGALKYACDNSEAAGARTRVINMSLGQDTSGVEPLYVEAVEVARRKGILVIASAGNNGESFVPPPANTPGVVAVGATGHYLNFEYLAAFSNYGERIDLVAPGESILTLVPEKASAVGSVGEKKQTTYSFASGTSEAAPYVSGVAALLFAKYDPNNASLASPEQAAAMVDKIRAHLLKSVDDLGPPGWDPGFGWGRLNANKALTPATLP